MQRYGSLGANWWVSIRPGKTPSGFHPCHPCDPSYPWEKKPTDKTDHTDDADVLSFDPEFSKKAGGNVFLQLPLNNGKWKLLFALPPLYPLARFLLR